MASSRLLIHFSGPSARRVDPGQQRTDQAAIAVRGTMMRCEKFGPDITSPQF
jgi:hypothetical protein